MVGTETRTVGMTGHGDISTKSIQFHTSAKRRRAARRRQRQSLDKKVDVFASRVKLLRAELLALRVPKHESLEESLPTLVDIDNEVDTDDEEETPLEFDPPTSRCAACLRLGKDGKVCKEPHDLVEPEIRNTMIRMFRDPEAVELPTLEDVQEFKEQFEAALLNTDKVVPEGLGEFYQYICSIVALPTELTSTSKSVRRAADKASSLIDKAGNTADYVSGRATQLLKSGLKWTVFFTILFWAAKNCLRWCRPEVWKDDMVTLIGWVRIAGLSILGAVVAEEIISALEVFTAEHQKVSVQPEGGEHPLAQFMSFLCCVFVEAKQSTGSLLSSVAKVSSAMPKITSGMSTAMDALIWAMENISPTLTRAVVEVTGLSKALSLPPKASDLLSNAIQLLDEYHQKGESIFQDATFCDQVIRVHAEASNARESLIESSSSGARTIFTQVMKDFEPLQVQARISQETGTFRQHPIGLLLTGKPGTGKTDFMTKLAEYLRSALEWEEACMWSCNIACNFADGYFGQDMVYMDDVGQQEKEPMLQYLLTWLSTSPTITNQAFAKGKIAMSAELIAASTNHTLADFAKRVAAFPGAVERRFNSRLGLTVHFEVKKPYATKQGRVDVEKLQAMTEVERTNLVHLKFTVFTDENQLGVEMSFRQIAQQIARKIRIERARFQNSVDAFKPYRAMGDKDRKKFEAEEAVAEENETEEEGKKTRDVSVEMLSCRDKPTVSTPSESSYDTAASFADIEPSPLKEAEDVAVPHYVTFLYNHNIISKASYDNLISLIRNGMIQPRTLKQLQKMHSEQQAMGAISRANQAITRSSLYVDDKCKRCMDGAEDHTSTCVFSTFDEEKFIREAALTLPERGYFLKKKLVTNLELVKRYLSRFIGSSFGKILKAVTLCLMTFKLAKNFFVEPALNMDFIDKIAGTSPFPKEQIQKHAQSIMQKNIGVNSEAGMGSYDRHEDYRAPVYQSKLNSAVRRQVVKQTVATETSVEQLNQCLANNCLEVSYTHKRGVNCLRGVMLEGTIALIPAHFFYPKSDDGVELLPEDTLIRVRDRNNIGFKERRFERRDVEFLTTDESKLFDKLLPGESVDLALYNFGMTVAPKKSIIHFIAKDIDSGKRDHMERFSLIGFNSMHEDVRVINFRGKTEHKARVVRSVLSWETDGSKYTNQKVYTANRLDYPPMTAAGDCGLLGIDMDPRHTASGVLRSMHLGKVNGSHSFGFILDRGYIRREVDKFKEKLAARSLPVVCEGVRLDGMRPDSNPCLPDLTPEGTFRHVGRLPESNHVSTRSHIIPSLTAGIPIAQKSLKTKQPVTLDDGSRGRNQFKAGITPFTTVKKPFPTRVAREAFGSIEDKMRTAVIQRGLSLQKSLGVLSLHTTINGDRELGLSSVPTGKSAGYPGRFWASDPERWGIDPEAAAALDPADVKGKRIFFSFVDTETGGYYECSNEKMKEHLLAYELAAQQGRRDEAVIFMACLKDEVRNLGKDARVFYAGPLNSLVLAKAYFGSLVAAVVAARFKCESAIGMNPYSLDWQTMIEHLKETSDVGFSRDTKKHETCIGPQFYELFLEAVNKIYRDLDPDYRPEDDLVRATILIDTLHSLIALGETVIEISNGNPSGSWLTIFLNIVYNMFLDRVTYLLGIEDAEERGEKLQAAMRGIRGFNAYVSSVFLGDDAITACSREVAHFFNAAVMAEIAGRYGITITDEDKKVPTAALKKIEDLGFLSNTTRVVDFPEIKNMHYMACLDEDSVGKMLAFTKTTLDPHVAAKTSVDTALTFAVGRGPKYFNELRGQCFRELAEQGVNHIPLSYSDAADIWERPEKLVSSYDPLPVVVEGKRTKLADKPSTRLILAASIKKTQEELPSDIAAESVTRPTQPVVVPKVSLLRMWQLILVLASMAGVPIPTADYVSAVEMDRQPEGVTYSNTEIPTPSHPMVSAKRKSEDQTAVGETQLDFRNMAKIRRVIGTGTWSVGAPQGSVLFSARHPWGLLDGVQWQGPTNFTFAKYHNMRVTVQVQGGPFYQGCLIAYFVPKTSDSEIDDTIVGNRASQYLLPHSMLMPGRAEAQSLDIAWMNTAELLSTRDTSTDLGGVRLEVFVPLATAATNPQTIDFTVFAEADAEFKVVNPDVTPAAMTGFPGPSFNGAQRLTTPQKIVGRIQGKTVVTAVEGGTYSRVTNIDHVTNASIDASSTSDKMGTDVSAAVKANDQPNIGIQPHQVTKRGLFLQQGTQVTRANVFSLYPAPPNPAQTSELGIDNSQLGLSYLMQHETVLGSGTWNASDSKGTNLFTTDLTPCPQLFLAQDQSEQNLTLLSYVAAPFNFWRGTLRYTITVYSSDMMTGRLLMVPRIGDLTAPGDVPGESLLPQYGEVCNLKAGNKTFTIDVPFQAEVVRKKVPAGNPVTKLDFTTGRLDILVLNNLVPMSTTAPFADFIVTVSMVDAEVSFYGCNNTSLYPRVFPPVAPTLALGVEEEKSVVTAVEMMTSEESKSAVEEPNQVGDTPPPVVVAPTTRQTKPITQMEPVPNVLHCMKRASPCLLVEKVTGPTDVALTVASLLCPEAPNDTSHGRSPTGLSWWTAPFRFYRGSIKFTLVTEGDVQVFLQYRPGSETESNFEKLFNGNQQFLSNKGPFDFNTRDVEWTLNMTTHTSKYNLLKLPKKQSDCTLDEYNPGVILVRIIPGSDTFSVRGYASIGDDFAMGGLYTVPQVSVKQTVPDTYLQGTDPYDVASTYTITMDATASPFNVDQTLALDVSSVVAATGSFPKDITSVSFKVADLTNAHLQALGEKIGDNQPRNVIPGTRTVPRNLGKAKILPATVILAWNGKTSNPLGPWDNVPVNQITPTEVETWTQCVAVQYDPDAYLSAKWKSDLYGLGTDIPAFPEAGTSDTRLVALTPINLGQSRYGEVDSKRKIAVQQL